MNSGAFSPRTALALVLAGAVVLVALLWAAGDGVGGADLDNGGAHAGATGLAGFAGLARLLAADGDTVTLARSTSQLGAPGLLVLTPPPDAKGSDIEAIVSRHRLVGPVMVIAPKWLVAPLPRQQPGVRAGWVRLIGALPPAWPGFHDEISVSLTPMPGGVWHGFGLHGTLPFAAAVTAWGELGQGLGLLSVPLVMGADGRVLVARIPGPSEDPYPLYLVAEPDLVNNYGLGHSENAALAEALFADAGGGSRNVTFDLTLNGLARPLSPLSLALAPPWLAATLCLLLAAAGAGWRGLLRFGPPLAEDRAIAFGKRALVDSAAGLILRSHRARLLGEPYVAAVRERLARALGLPEGLEATIALAAIDRALRLREDSAQPDVAAKHDPSRFSDACAALATARSEAAIVEAALRLHALERMLTQ